LKHYNAVKLICLIGFVSGYAENMFAVDVVRLFTYNALAMEKSFVLTVIVVKTPSYSLIGASY
jgi:hypothetical protein